MASKPSKTFLKKHKKTGNIYDPETFLVFKSISDKTVIGRMDDDEFVSLDQDCLDLCEQYNFKYDESLVEAEETEEAVKEEPKDDEDQEENQEPGTPVPKKGNKAEPSKAEPSKAEGKGKAKKTEPSKTEPSKTEDREEEEAPVAKPTKPTKTSKKEPEKDVAPVKKEAPTKGKVANTTSNKGVLELTDQINYLFTSMLGNAQEELNTAKEHVSELEKELVNSRKETEDVKKKLKGVLSSLQDSL